MLVQVDRGQDSPADGIGKEEMGKEFANIPKLANFKTMTSVVRVNIYRLKWVNIIPLELAETLSQESKEFFIGPLLSTAIYAGGNKRKTVIRFEKSDFFERKSLKKPTCFCVY
jgi:hypothetical protein